jgi:hypothetical protein
MKYEEILGLYEYFQPVYDITQERGDFWKQFIPTKDFIDTLRIFLNSLEAKDKKARKSIWIQGTYGTGKSHATGVIKHLLWDDIEYIEDFVEKIPDDQLKERLRNFRKGNKVFPVTLKGISGISDAKSFALKIEEAVRNALRDGRIDVKTKSEFEKYIDSIQNNKSINWRYIVDNSLELKSMVGSVEGLLTELENNNIEVLKILEKSIDFHIPHPSIEEWLSEILAELQDLDISHIAIYWDEFTPIMELSSSSALLTILQSIAEKSFNENLFLFVISHRLPEQTQVSRSDQEKVLGRFEFKTYSMENITTFHIISNTIKKKNNGEWEKLKDKIYDKNLGFTRVLRKLTENNTNLLKTIKNLFPIHPYTAQLATAISQYIGSTERSIFNFLYDENRGFAKFIKEYPREETGEYFLTSDILWDYFLDDFKRRQEDKINSIIGKYNMAYEDLNKKGSQYLAIFKGILLLNLVQSYTTSSPSESSIYAPSKDNILDMFLGTKFADNIDKVLDYIDEKYIHKTPDGLYLISQTPLPINEVNEAKDAARREYEDVTKLFTKEQKKRLGDRITDNILRETNVQIYWAGINKLELKRKIRNDFITSYTLNIAFFLPKSTSEIYDLKNNIINLIEEDERAQNMIFILSNRELGKDNYDRLLEYIARKNIAERHSYFEEAKVNERYVERLLDQWLEGVEKEYIEIIYQNKIDKIPFDLLEDRINKSLSPEIFRFGLENLERLTENRNVWEFKFSDKVAEIFLYEDKRDFLEEKLKNAPYKYLLGILLSNNGEYIVDKILKFRDDVDPDHPTVKICREVENTLKNREGTNFNLGDVLEFLRRPPYGLYPNMANYAVLSFVLKPFIGKLYESGTGRKLTKELLKEKVSSIFKYWTNGKDRDKLEVRLGTSEEKELTDILAYLFDIKESESLNSTRWRIREWVKHIGLPVWSLKELVQNNNGLLVAIDAINYVVRTLDRELLEDKIKSILGTLKHTKIDLKLLLNPKSFKEGFAKWLKSLDNIGVEDDDIEEIIEYLNKNMQEEVVYWTEDKVRLKLKDWKIERDKNKYELEFVKTLKEIFKLESVQTQIELKDFLRKYIDQTLGYPLWVLKKVIGIEDVNKVIKFIEDFIRLDYELSQDQTKSFLDDLRPYKDLISANLQTNIIEQGLSQWLKERNIPEKDITDCLEFIRNDIKNPPHLWEEKDLEECLIRFEFAQNIMSIFNIEDINNIEDLRHRIKDRVHSFLYPFWSFELIENPELTEAIRDLREFILSNIPYPMEHIRNLSDKLKKNFGLLKDTINDRMARDLFIHWLKMILGFEDELINIAEEIRRKMPTEEYYWNKDRVENWIYNNFKTLISEKKKERLREKIKSTDKDLKTILLEIIDKYPQIISDLEVLL